jgi:hypothetical protein
LEEKPTELTKVKEKFSLPTPLRYIGDAKLKLQPFLILALDGGDWSAAPQLSPEETSPTPIRYGT